MKSRIATKAAIAATCLTVLASAAQAQPMGAQPMGAAPMSSPVAPTMAPEYLRMASSGDLFEIQSSQLALQVSQDPAVKSLAQKIINDHTRLSTELKAAAASGGVPVPPPMLAMHHQQQLDGLRSAGSANFDAAYRQAQVMAHQEALNLHRAYAAGGDVPALRTAAQAAVPVIEMHLQMVQGLPAHAGHSMGAMPTGGSSGEEARLRAGERG